MSQLRPLRLELPKCRSYFVLSVTLLLAMLVLHTPLSTLHAPKHEILSGALVPYFESPARVQLILNSLLADSKSRFYALPQVWELQELEQEWFLGLINEVHEGEYLCFLRTVYSQWVGEGGNPVSSRLQQSTS